MSKKRFVLHTMGKVGSNTIRRTTRNLGQQAIRTHVLTGDLRYILLRYGERLAEIGNIPYAKDLKAYAKRSKKISKEVRKYEMKGNRLKVITAVREPLSHAISAFFMNVHLHMRVIEKLDNSKYYDPAIKYFTKWTNYYVNLSDYEKRKSKEKNIIRDLGKHYLNWPSLFISTEIKKAWNIDLFSQNFEDGWDYNIYKIDSCDLMVIKYEKFGCLESAISEFFNIDYNKIKVMNGNVSSNKFYGGAMKYFLDNIVFNEKFIDKIFSTEYVKCFYSDKEIDGFKKKWLKNK